MTSPAGSDIGMGMNSDKPADKPADKPTGAILDALYETVAARKGADPATSYTAELYSRGTQKIAQKMGEEAVEAVIAAVERDRGEIVKESADLLYHLMVVWADAGLRPEEVYAELIRRQGISGQAEKAARKGGSAT